MKQPPLKAYRFKIAPHRHIKLIKLFDLPYHTDEEVKFFNGWASTPWGWMIDPLPFRQRWPRACVFTRKEYNPRHPNLVKAWLYTPSGQAFFKNEEDRNMFQCWVDPACLYEVDMS